MKLKMDVYKIVQMTLKTPREQPRNIVKIVLTTHFRTLIILFGSAMQN